MTPMLNIEDKINCGKRTNPNEVFIEVISDLKMKIN